MRYLYCQTHKSQVLWFTSEGPRCCQCLREKSHLAGVLVDFPAKGHYLGTPEEIRAKEYPLCDVCGEHYAIKKGHTTCEGKELKSFNTADWYSVNEDGELHHTCWEDCIGEHMDASHENDVHIVDQIDTIAPLEVFAWKRKTLPPNSGLGDTAIDRMLEDFDEYYWCEEYGGVEEESPPWEGEALANTKKTLYSAMEECLQTADIWQCEIVGSRVFSKEELTEFMKSNEPELFTDQPNETNETNETDNTKTPAG